MKAPLPSPYLDGEWIPERCLIKEFAGQLNTLKKGNYSAPFFFSFRYSHRVFIGSQARCVFIRSDCKYGCAEGANSVSTERTDSLLNKTRMELCQVADGLLAAYWDKRHGGTKSGNISDKELQSYFESHKKRLCVGFASF